MREPGKCWYWMGPVDATISLRPRAKDIVDQAAIALSNNNQERICHTGEDQDAIEGEAVTV